MRKIFLILFIFTFKGEVVAQNLRGIWTASHILETDKIISDYSLDTVQSAAYALLDFIDNQNVIIKTHENDIERLTYYIEDNKVYINVGKENINGVIEKNQIILTYKNDSIKKGEVFFKKITPSELNSSQLPDSTLFHNTNWILEAEHSSLNKGLSFDILGNDKVIITKVEGDIGYSLSSKFTTDFYKNHFFIGIVDRDFEERIYHIYKKEDNIFFGESYEVKMFTPTPIEMKKIKFVKKDTLTNKQIDLLRSNFIGNWKAINNPIPFRSSGKYDRLESPKYEISFKEDGSYQFVESGVLIKDNLDIPKEFKDKGIWQLGRTGKYIWLTSNINRNKNLITIKKISKDSLQIYLTVKHLDRKLYRESYIELRK